MGCLVLLIRNSCFDDLPIPTECYFDSVQSLESKIVLLESDPAAFNSVLLKQQHAFSKSFIYGASGLQLRVSVISFFKTFYLYSLFDVMNRILYFIHFLLHHITFRLQRLLK